MACDTQAVAGCKSNTAVKHMSAPRHNPPKIFLRFFRWYCHPKLRDGIEGDMVELYQERVHGEGKRAANLKFMIDVISLFRPGIVRKFNFNLTPSFMFGNYLKISWRYIVKNKAFSAINVLGLAIGLAACVLIFEFVSFELSFDRFNSKVNRIFRVTNDRLQNGKLIQHGTIMYPTIGHTMAKDFPEIEEHTRLMPVGEMNVRVNDKNFRGDIGFFADERFLRVFDYKLIAGDRTTLLASPFTVALSEKTARKFFNYNDDDLSTLIGKTFLWGLDEKPYEVKGIFENVPSNSHLQFDALISYTTLTVNDPDADNSWRWSDMYHYIVLKAGADPKTLEGKFPEFSQRYFKGTEVTGSIEKFYLQPLADAHLYSDYEYDIATTASGKAVWSMLIVAIFILVIAWINYINLTTSRAIDRGKEVGLRKVMGAFKSQLIMQFIFETILLTAMAALIAITITTIVQPSFNEMVGIQLSWKLLLTQLTSQHIWIVIVALCGGAILAGFYPAFILSRYQPVTVLKGKFARSAKGNFLRKSLVVFQFTMSATLICGTLVVTKQLRYMNTTDLGINLKNILVVREPELVSWDSTFISRVEDFKHTVKNISGIVNATTSWRLPGDRLGRAFNVRVDGQPKDLQYTVSHMGVDFDYFKTMEVDLLAGRSFTPADHNPDFGKLKSIIINKHAMHLFGFKDPSEAIGQQLLWGGEDGMRKWEIIGVMNDYHQEALQKPMEPIVFRPAYSTNSPISIKINAIDQAHILSLVEATYKKFFPGNSFEYTFLEDRYNKQYADDKRFGTVIGIFTALAILVACLGLIGLSSYTAALRTKEIGIRKTLGASVANIVSLLSVEFVSLVAVSGLISLPIAYVGLSRWLEAYPYRITLNWFTFLIPVMLIILIAAITIGFHVLKTALTKPVETLRYE
jgi:putative ABC transport system permease protein